MNRVREKFSIRKKGQTTIEYLLIMIGLLLFFVAMYRFLQWYLARDFQSGGVIVLRMYKQDPW